MISSISQCPHCLCMTKTTNGICGKCREKKLYKRGDSMIIVNAARCKICGDIIISKHRHDFVTCSCGNVSVDGGNDYRRRIGINMAEFEDLSVLKED